MKTMTVRLGDVAAIERTVASEGDCATLPYVGLEHIEKDSGNFTADFARRPEELLATKFRFTPRHVLYGKLRPYLNKVALPDFAGVCTTEILPICPEANALDRGFLFGLLLSPAFVAWASHSVSGANLPRLDPELLQEYEFVLPPLPEQRRIAGLLELADRLRRTRRYTLELSDTFLPAAFLEIFGDPAMNPKGFPTESVGSVFSKQREGAKCGPFGTALKKQEYVPDGIPVWTMENVGQNEFQEEGCLYITPPKYDELKAYDAQNGDILVSRAGTVGRMAVVRTKYPRSIIHSNIIRLSLDPALCLPVYFSVLMTYFASRVGRLKRGQEDAYTFMNTSRLAEIQILLPPFPVQQKFAALVERHERLRAVQRESLRQAEHLFQSLLHQSFAQA